MLLNLRKCFFSFLSLYLRLSSSGRQNLGMAVVSVAEIFSSYSPFGAMVSSRFTTYLLRQTVGICLEDHTITRPVPSVQQIVFGTIAKFEP
jgi:hypothetical protein